MPFRAFLFLLALALVFSGCRKEDDEPDTTDYNRGALLTNYADNLIVPAYETWSADMESLTSALDALEANTDQTNLDAARSALHTARLSWQSASLFDFGPAFTQGLNAVANVYPLDVEQLTENLEESEVNLEIPANLSAGGFEGLDYLLFGIGENDADILDHLAGNGQTAALPYAQQIAELLRGKAQSVLSGWTTDGNSYRATYVVSTGTDVGSGLGLTLNAFNRIYEQEVRKNKIGLPSGGMTFSMSPLPDHVEGAFSQDHSLAYLKAALVAVENAFYGIGADGTDRDGLDDYLSSLDAQYNGQSLVDIIATQQDDMRSTVDGLPEPLIDAVVNQQSDCLDAYTELQQIVVLYKVDMMSAFGILITYLDNDGD